MTFIALLVLSPWFLSGCGIPSTARLESNLPPTRPANPPEAKKAPTIAAPAAQLVQMKPPQEQKPVPPPPPVATKDKAEAKVPVGRQEKKGSEEKAKAQEEPPTALQEAPGPKADDRLLGLWQMELEKAMQQPPGRRKIQFSIPLVENDRVRYFVDLFCGRMREFFKRALARSGKYIPMMATILQEAGLPEDLVYLSLIESGFSASARSRARAVGPWQFIRSTGIRYGLRIDSWVDERRDPVKSTQAAVVYLKELHQQFGEWFLAAAAYNAGERKVETAMNRSNANDFWDLSEKKSHLKSETRNYVPKFIAATLIASAPEKYGFGDLVYESPVEYDEVRIDRPMRFETIARLAQATVGEIKELNPALLQNTTPPGNDGFVLRLPAGRGKIFTDAYALSPVPPRVKTLVHTVKKGETLSAIAKRYHLRVSQLMEANDLKTSLIRVGQQLMIVQDGAVKK